MDETDERMKYWDLKNLKFQYLNLDLYCGLFMLLGKEIINIKERRENYLLYY